MIEKFPDQNTRQCFLEYAILTGDRLLGKSLRDKQGLYWLTFDTFAKSATFSSDLYSGTSGVAFFMLQLFRVSREQRFLEAARSAASKLMAVLGEPQSRKSAAFYSGELGTAFFLLKLSRETGESEYLEFALRLARRSRESLLADDTPDDLLNGRAGTLLGLLLLYAETGDAELLSLMNLGLEKLMSTVHISDQGIYWDRSWRNIRGLCGFSHGASGMAHVFLELGHFFGEPSLLKLSKLAFDYEEALFDKDLNNWPDYRAHYLDEKHQEVFEAIEQGRLSDYRNPSDMNAWCHGAVGAGLARVRAYQLTQEPRYLDSLKAAVAKTLASIRGLEDKRQWRSAGFCHGEEGDAELLLEYGLMFDDRPALDAAVATGQQAISWFVQHGHFGSSYVVDNVPDDPALFMGEAGSGLFFLRIAAPEICDSLTLPRVTRREDLTFGRFQSISTGDRPLELRLLSRLFPRSLELFNRFALERLSAFFGAQENQKPQHLGANFISFFNAALPGLDAAVRPYFEDAGALEWEMLELDRRGLSFFEDGIREVYAGEVLKPRMENTPAAELLNWTVKTSDAVSVLLAKWPWHDKRKSLEEILSMPEGQIPVMLMRGGDGLSAQQIPPHAYNILLSAVAPQSIERLIEGTLDDFGEITQAEREVLGGSLLLAVRTLITGSLLRL